MISIPATALCEVDLLSRQITDLQERYRSDDRRAVASVWVKRYCSALLPDALTEWACGGNVRDPSVEGTAIVIKDHAPVAIEFSTSASIPWAAFPERLFGGHLKVLFEAVHQVSDLSKRVMWSNAANVAAWKLGNLIHSGEPPPKASAAYDLLLETMQVAWYPDANPLYQSITWAALDDLHLPSHVHRRRLCCLRHRLGEPFCYSCPRIGLDECVRVLRSSNTAL